MEMAMAKMSSKNQITVPAIIRDFLDLNPGDKVIFIKDDNGVRMHNASAVTIETCGSERLRE
ncbi:MAG: AbrB/MazE/SpoVT family DNA-binding domain-containing protein [Desulfovibrio sp.]|jgi:AbrB family looped-hinge helix DNA binding protein|nr:AbrB/MazE/SpoVT family DNA-binding domain-containing protein [Desulfovibrio sp.]